MEVLLAVGEVSKSVTDFGSGVEREDLRRNYLIKALAKGRWIGLLITGGTERGGESAHVVYSSDALISWVSSRTTSYRQ